MAKTNSIKISVARGINKGKINRGSGNPGAKRGKVQESGLAPIRGKQWGV